MSTGDGGIIMKKTLWQKVKCFVRKWMSAKIIPYMVLNGWRIFFYRLCGYNIGKNVFIGMRCYLDDLEPHMFTVEDDCTISYGVFLLVMDVISRIPLLL